MLWINPMHLEGKKGLGAGPRRASPVPRSRQREREKWERQN